MKYIVDVRTGKLAVCREKRYSVRLWRIVICWQLQHGRGRDLQSGVSRPNRTLYHCIRFHTRPCLPRPCPCRLSVSASPRRPRRVLLILWAYGIILRTQEPQTFNSDISLEFNSAHRRRPRKGVQSLAECGSTECGRPVSAVCLFGLLTVKAWIGCYTCSY